MIACAPIFAFAPLLLSSILVFIFNRHLSELLSLQAESQRHTLYHAGQGQKEQKNNSFASISVPFLRLMKGPLAQDDPRIIDYIWRKRFLRGPSRKPYRLRAPRTKDPSMGQASIVQKILNYKINGYFVECGALDGEMRSNTLWLERSFKWKGLLIEGDPLNHKQLLRTRRKAWTADCCLAIHPYPHEVGFEQDSNLGTIKTDEGNSGSKVMSNKTKPVVQRQCFPLFSLLAALNVTTVDYFSLDVEGYELDVLKTIPFDKINIKVLSVEYAHVPGGEEALELFMKERKFRVATKLTHKLRRANDFIFVREDIPYKATFPVVIESLKI